MDRNVYRALGRYTFVHFTEGRFRISGRILVLGQDDRDLVVTEIGVSPDVAVCRPSAAAKTPDGRVRLSAANFVPGKPKSSQRPT
jgi:hypothetical protein